MTRTSPTYIHGRIIIYLYFPLGRLARENDEDRSVTICYNYDSNGNILSKVEYPYTTGALTSAIRTVPYTYAVSWGDQLLTYNNGSTILYDQIGNPLSYNGYTFTWQKGRQLASANDGTNSYQFIYNADGQRTWKTKNNSSIQYTYASGLLVSMTDGTNTLNFTYDPDGIALGVNLNGTDYYYLYNAQGDVIALYDSAGTVVTEYKYDSWGKVLSVTGSAANTIGLQNPLRYRGYFYDTDLGFYLLESRYYDPETGRFINADGVLDNRVEGNKNLYAYCANDPINYCDENGRWLASMVAGAVIGAASGAITAWAKGGSKKDIKRAAFYGGISGAVSGLIGGVLGNIRTASKLAKCGVALGRVATNIAVSKWNRSKTATIVGKKTKTKTVGSRKKTVSSKATPQTASKNYPYSGKVSVSSVSGKTKLKSAVIEYTPSIVGGIITASLGAGTDEAVNALSFTGQMISSLALDTFSTGVETSLDLAFWELFPGEQK